EFLNRIDDTLLFNPLSTAQLREIVGLQLHDSEQRLGSQGITLTVNDAAKGWIAEASYEPAYGARPMRRGILRQLDDKVADLLVAEAIVEGDSVVVTVADYELRVTPVRAPMQLVAYSQLVSCRQTLLWDRFLCLFQHSHLFLCVLC